jgi:hypothetical protein
MLIAAAAGVALLSLSLAPHVLHAPPQPSYKGQSLRLWVEGVSSEPSYAQEEALNAMGTNATPLLLKWMRYETPGWRAALYKGANKVRALLKKPQIYDRRHYLAEDAATALLLIGQWDRGTISELTKISQDPKDPKQKTAQFILLRRNPPRG